MYRICNLNLKFFIVPITIIAIFPNYRSVWGAETTPEIVDVDVIEETTATTPASTTATTPSPSTIPAYISSNSINIQSRKEFNEIVLNSTKPIIVQFHAPWSDLCPIATSRIGKAVDDKNGKIKLARVDINEHEKLGLDFMIQSVPCIAAFRAGELIEKLTGLQEENDLKVFVGKYIVDYDGR